LLEALPVREQLFLVQFGPGFHEPALTPRQRSSNQVDGFQTEYPDIVLIVRMEVRQMMRAADLHIHSNDNPEEAT